VSLFSRLIPQRRRVAFGPVAQLEAYPPLKIQVHAKFDRFISAQIAESGEWEPFETSLVEKLLRPGDTFVDIGANIGWYTIVAAALVGLLGRVYAFEPEPLNFALATHNVALNGLKNVTLARMAIADADGRLPLYLSADNLGDHQLYEAGDERESQSVPTVSLGSYFARHPGGIRLIKTDAQGSEAKIFAGIPDEFVRKHDVAAFILEYWPYGLTASGKSAEALIERLAALDLECFVIQEEMRGLDPIALDVLARRAHGDLRPETRFFANLLAVPRSSPLPDRLRPLIRPSDAPLFYRE
jgi:FkbM family methyltransferase